jgi:hypothetical protein
MKSAAAIDAATAAVVATAFPWAALRRALLLLDTSLFSLIYHLPFTKSNFLTNNGKPTDI